jgi:hypothetical protein
MQKEQERLLKLSIVIPLLGVIVNQDGAREEERKKHDSP